MTRHPIPRFLLRSRRLLVESLDERIVLSGVPNAAPIAEPDAAVAESTLLVANADAAAPVYLENDGTLHVQPPSEDANIVIRQYVNYELQKVVEVELDGQWTAFPVEQVEEIQVHKVAATQIVEVEDGVTIPVQLVEPELVDAAIDSVVGDSLGTVPGDVAVGLLEPDAEGEPPGGVGQELHPPTIHNFSAVQDGIYWLVSGSVTDDDSVLGLEVRFGGLLDGEHTTVAADGTFSYLALFAPGTTGGISAVVTDVDGLTSSPVTAWVE